MGVLDERIILIESKLKDIEDETISNDIQFLMGAINQLRKYNEKLELSLSTDISKANENLEKKRAKYNEVRQLLSKKDNQVTKYKAVINQVKKLKAYYPYKDLRKELASLKDFEKKW